MNTTTKHFRTNPGVVKRLASAVALSALLGGALVAHAGDSEKTMEQHMQDGWREGKVETLFFINPNLNNFALDADVDGDTVTLSGTVHEAIDSELAEAIAASVEGVTSVKNRIVVDPSPRVANKDIENLKQEVTDIKLLTLVKGKLVKNPHIAGFAIDVDADDGVVSLYGEVDSPEAKDLTTWLAMSTHGVVNVENHLVVSESAQS